MVQGWGKSCISRDEGGGGSVDLRSTRIGGQHGPEVITDLRLGWFEVRMDVSSAWTRGHHGLEVRMV